MSSDFICSTPKVACRFLRKLHCRRLTCRLAHLECALGRYKASLYVGIDLRASALHAVLVDDELRLLGTRNDLLAVASLRPGYSEQHPSAAAMVLHDLRDP